MQDCLLNHEQCPRPDSSFIPTRLIDVGKDDGKQSIRVHLTSGEKTPYAALSYCWGDSQRVTMTTVNMNDMLHGIATSTLPQTIQDAITVTRKLDLQYLWVDALCIIQDSASDKGEEIAKMDRIYQNAQLTIFAASAEKCQDSFLATRSLRGDSSPSIILASVPFACPNVGSGTVSLRKAQTYWMNHEPLSKRGWALQERVLSSRMIIYSLWQMYLQCESQMKSDGGRTDRFNGKLAGLSVLSNHQMQSSGHIWGTSDDAIWSGWAKVVINYIRRGLAQPSDKLPALSGIATRFQNATNDVYCAGLWKSSLLKGLKWIVAPPPHQCRPSIYRAPTWSWASVLGIILMRNYHRPRKHSAASHTLIVDCRVTLEDASAAFGKVREGKLTIRGVVRTLNWNGDEQIPRADFDPAMIPIPAKGIVPPRFLDGIIALAKPDFSRKVCHVKSDSADQSLKEVTFHIGWSKNVVNEIRLLMFLVPIDQESALMLKKVGERMFTRLGYVEFKNGRKLEQYFDGCEQDTFTIY